LVFRCLFAASSILLAFAALGHAAPALRLTNSTVGPVSIAVGGSVSAPLLEAYNGGDGNLTVGTPQISVSWVTATVGAAAPCQTTTLASTCFPIQLHLNVAGLAASSTPYSGSVTITAPGAVDAPQNIAVLAQVGGAVPSNVSVYVAPGAVQQVPFTTNSLLNSQTKTNDGNSWLSLDLDGTGSFRFVLPYYIQVAPQPSQTSGTYTGTITTSGSNFSGDNKTVAVTMNVTSQPIAQASPPANVLLAQGAAPLTYPCTPLLTVGNAGIAALTLQSPAVTGGSWLTATGYAGGAVLSYNPSGLAPGSYSANVTIASNAANGAVSVPVTMQVEATGSPYINYQGVLDNATFVPGDSVAPGDIVIAQGDQLSLQGYTAGQAPPLANTVGGAGVLVNGEAAPLYYSCYGQLAFQMPTDTATGTALVTVQRSDGSTSNTASVTVAPRAPKILLIGGGPYGAIVNATDGSFPAPVGTFPGSNAHPATAGDVLTIYAIGMGPTNPPVATGAPAPSSAPLAQLTVTPTINFGGSIAPVFATPSFAGLSPTYAGLYQINVTIPPNTSKGVTALSIVFPDSTSNTVQIALQ
jgi:uncharacterized protein (TIGR03437 family)